MSLGTQKADRAKTKIARLTKELAIAKGELKAAAAVIKDEKANAKAKKK